MKSSQRNIIKLTVVGFFTNLYFYLPVITLYLQSKQLNFVQINSLWGIIVATLFFTEVPTGVLADRVGRKRAVNIALGLQLLGELIFLFARDYWAFAMAAIAGGLGFAFASGSLEALVYDSLKAGEEERGMTRAMGLIDTGKRTANLLAFAGGGIRFSQLTTDRFVLAIGLTAVAVAIGWLISWTLVEPEIVMAPEQGESPGQLLAQGIRSLQQDKTFRRLALLALASTPFVNYLLNLYQPRFVEIDVPNIWLGLALSLASAVAILGARYAYLLEARLGSRLSLLGVTLLPGFLYLLLALVKQPALAVLVFIILYGSTSLKGPIFSGTLNRHIDSRNRATVLSIISMISGIYVALMGLVLGRVADSSLAAAFLVMGVIVLIGSLLFRAE